MNVRSPGTVSVCAINFWGSFSLKTGFVSYLLNRAFGDVRIVEDERDADIVVSSIMVRQLPLDPRRTICFIWENIRPDYRHCSYSISSDFDTYGGRNCRVPLWYGQLQWPGYLPEQADTGGRASHGWEMPVEIERLLQPRPVRPDRDNDLFCCYIASNPELHRQYGVEALSRIGDVDVYGKIANKPLRSSKYDLLRRYRFNLCFENSIFPGYYTEKVIHAWAGGCVPLYYSDNWYVDDFNPKAVINRINFGSLDEFAQHVALVNKSPSALNDIFGQPLLSKRPALEPAIDFLRRAHETIMRDARRKPANWPAFHVKGRTCPCGSGKRFTRCHGRLRHLLKGMIRNTVANGRRLVKRRRDTAARSGS